MLQQALVTEQPERLAQGVARDLERRADALLRQALTWDEEPLGDPVTKDVGDHLRRAAAPETTAIAL